MSTVQLGLDTHLFSLSTEAPKVLLCVAHPVNDGHVRPRAAAGGTVPNLADLDVRCVRCTI